MKWQGVGGLFAAGDTATVNVTVTTVSAINFTDNNINFGNGTVDSGKDYAVLESNGTSAVDGSWDWGSPDNISMENVGNQNLTLNFSFADDADSLVGGTSSNNEYSFMLSSEEAASACTEDGITKNQWYPANTSGKWICSNYNIDDAADELTFDIRVKIPSDSRVNNLGSTITAYAHAV